MPLTKAEFRDRFFARLYDSAFDEVAPALDQVFEKARDSHYVYRKSPRTRPAGPGHADPEMALPLEWLATKAAIQAGERRRRQRASSS